jgi:hypothetical protein
MMKLKNRTNRIALMAICCAFGVLLPTEGFADLNNIACKAIRRGCNSDCHDNGGSQSCYGTCLSNYQNCAAGVGTKKQQTPPPPCTGFRCTLHNPHPPTTVGPTPPPPRPYQPVAPTGLSNPNKTSTGNNPVILERGHESGGHGSH